MAIRDYEGEIPAKTARVMKSHQEKNRRSGDKPFLRYHVIDMPDRMKRRTGRSLQPMRSERATVCTTVKNGAAANKKLVNWIEQQGERAVSHVLDKGELFEARYETYLTDASARPTRTTGRSRSPDPPARLTRRGFEDGA